MKRFLLMLVSACSVLLVGVVVAFWVRSMHVCEMVGKEITYTDGVYCVGSSRGVFTVIWWRLNVMYAVLPEWRYERWTPPLAGDELHAEQTKAVWSVSGLSYRAEAVIRDDMHQLLIPYWMLAAPLAAVAVVTGLHAARLRRRRRPGLCCRCGYDLRASPERCPECGIAHQV
jgi:hypothetical protein